MKQAISLLLALALALSLGLVTGMPAVASATTWYVDAEIPVSGNGTAWEYAFKTITEAITAAGAGDTVEVAAGTYDEDLIIPAGKDGVEIAGVYTTVKPVIKGVASGTWGDWPNHAVATGVEILSNEVKIHGFTIETPDVADGYAFSIVLTGTDIEIFDNDFVGIGDDDSYTVAIQTFRVDAMPTSDITGLQIYDNTFTSAGDLSVYQGVFINRDSADGLVTVADNVFTGNIHTGIANEGSNALISGNTLTSDYAGAGIVVMDWDDTRAQDNVEITGNTVEGFNRGIVVGHGDGGQTLTNISVTENTVQDNAIGVLVRSSAGGLAINLNNIVGNTGLGVSNTDTTRLGARYNWWGHETGPDHDGLNLGGQGDAVSDDVHIGPWLYRPHEQFAPGAPCYAGSVVLASEATQVTANNVTGYRGGWNSFSTPIALDSSANTVSKLLALTTGNGLFIERAQRFDVATEKWVAIIMGNQLVGPDYTIRPGEGFFIQVRSAGSIPILVRTDLTEPTTRNLFANWNLIGLSSLKSETVSYALSGVDYSFVLSTKPPNSEAWSVTPDGADDQDMKVGEAYWVAMGQSGTLFVTTTTPVADDMTWDLNQLDE